MAKIKICGLRRQEDICYVNKLKPDYGGFILSAGFRRSIDINTLRELVGNISQDIVKIGVFVDEPIDNVNRIIADGLIDIAQLHGNENADYCKKIKAPVIKVLKPDTFSRADEYEPFVDYYMFDSGTGSGELFDWNKIPKTERPFFLAGGLNSDNLTAAIKNINPYAVDMSSSVETDGIKDFNKIKEVILIVRGAEK